MLDAALLLAAFLQVPPVLVSQVYEVSGIEGVAVVWCESGFNPSAARREPEGTSWGLWQLYDKYHPQHRDNLDLHIIEGALFLEWCLTTEHGDFVRAVSRWNSGSPTKSETWGRRVLRKRNELIFWVAVHFQIAGGKSHEM